MIDFNGCHDTMYSFYMAKTQLLQFVLIVFLQVLILFRLLARVTLYVIMVIMVALFTGCTMMTISYSQQPPSIFIQVSDQIKHGKNCTHTSCVVEVYVHYYQQLAVSDLLQACKGLILYFNMLEWIPM